MISGTKRLFKAGIDGKQWNYLVPFFSFSFSASLLVEQPVAVLAMHWGWGPLIISQ
jgi:hypothetical protein